MHVEEVPACVLEQLVLPHVLAEDLAPLDWRALSGRDVSIGREDAQWWMSIDRQDRDAAASASSRPHRMSSFDMFGGTATGAIT